MNNPGLCGVMWASTSDLFCARQFISPHWHPISQTIKMINQVLIEYQGTYFNWWGKQLMASCLFEVIILGLFPSASWEEVASLVQMLFVRSQNGEAASQHATEEIQANWNRTMALPSLYPISQRTMLSLWHFSIHMKDKPCFYGAIHCTHFCDILVLFALKCVRGNTSLCIASNVLLTPKAFWCGYNHLVPDCVLMGYTYSILMISCCISGLYPVGPGQFEQQLQ